MLENVFVMSEKQIQIRLSFIVLEEVVYGKFKCSFQPCTFSFSRKDFKVNLNFCFFLNHAFGRFWYHHGDLLLQNIRYSKHVHPLNIFLVLISFSYDPTGW